MLLSLRTRSSGEVAEVDDAGSNFEALRGFDTLMVATHAPNGVVHARPMKLVEVDKGGDLWFVTNDRSRKVEEIHDDAAAVITGQSRGNFVSVSGTLELVRDRERFEAKWRPSWRLWFPGGRRDAHATMLRFRPAMGEYWLVSGLKGIRYLYEATRALLDRTTPRDDLPVHAKVTL